MSYPMEFLSKTMADDLWNRSCICHTQKFNALLQHKLLKVENDSIALPRSDIRTFTAMPHLTKRDLILRISQETGMQQDKVRIILGHAFAALTDSLAEGKTVEFRDFGVFKPRLRQARVGRNPTIPAVAILVPQQKVIKFTMGRIMREKVGRLPLEKILKP